MKTIFAAIGVLVVLFILVMFAICNDDDQNSLSTVQLASHYDDGGDCDWSGDCGDDSYRHDYSNHDRNRNRNRDRGAFSPGPFRDSPVVICAPYSCNSGGEQSGGNRQDQPPPGEGQR